MLKSSGLRRSVIGGVVAEEITLVAEVTEEVDETSVGIVCIVCDEISFGKVVVTEAGVVANRYAKAARTRMTNKSTVPFTSLSEPLFGGAVSFFFEVLLVSHLPHSEESGSAA